MSCFSGNGILSDNLSGLYQMQGVIECLSEKPAALASCSISAYAHCLNQKMQKRLGLRTLNASARSGGISSPAASNESSNSCHAAFFVLNEVSSPQGGSRLTRSTVASPMR